MLAPNRFEPREARAAGDVVVLGMHLEPQAGCATGEGVVEVLRLEAQAGAERAGRASVSAGLGHGRAQAFAVSEPLPLGVLMPVQVPAGTLFHELPW